MKEIKSIENENLLFNVLENVLENIKNDKYEIINGKKIYARKKYSKNSYDDYLEVVLAKIDNGEFVTWIYNKSLNGFYLGHYFINVELAIKDFIKR